MLTAPPSPQPAVATPFRESERRTPQRPCLNCGDPTPGNFCRSCGQRKVEVHVSLVRMLMEALDDQFSINSALPRTLGALLFRPGHLTREYMNGRIVRYIPPFRLYLVTSVVFFLALSLLPELRDPAHINGRLGEGVTIGPTSIQSTTTSDAPRPTPPPAVRAGHGARPTAPPVPPAPAHLSWLDGVKVHTGDATVDSVGNARIDHFRRMEPGDALRQIVSDYLGHVPQMMFVLLPFFAGLLSVLYVGSRRFYVEHFVFALHVHAFAFMMYLAMIVLRWGPLVNVLGLWLCVYFYLALKRVYRQGWLITGVKYFTLGMVYSIAATIAALLTLMVTLLLA